jgi:hypothetical protein
MTGLELILASHLLLQPVSSGSAAKCPVQQSARVDVHWRSEPVKYDHTQTFDDLGHQGIDSKNPYGTHVATDVGGLMSGRIQYRSGIEISSLRYPSSNVSCFWIEKVSVDIVIDPLVQIAREHPEGSCDYVAILEHEQKHVTTDRAVVKDHLEDIRTVTGAAVQKVGVVGPKPSPTGDSYKKKMSDYIEAQLKVAMDKMYADRIARQQKIDTRQEYDRVQAQCPKAR